MRSINALRVANGMRCGIWGGGAERLRKVVAGKRLCRELDGGGFCGEELVAPGE